ncbi:MAG: shikimate kinase [Flavobacteriales bacterium]|nr:shikimate kinase [Flavobacteriales bacterium]
MKVIIVGYMASGKSVVAKRLAQLLNLRFVDTDKWIEARSCKTIPEIFSEDGEDVFRAKEKECLEFLMDQDDMVISTGGGMPCFNDCVDLMLELGETVYLEASVQTLISRLWDGKSGRPIVNNFQTKEDLQSFISKHLSEREGYYKKCKHVVCVDGKSVGMIAKEITSILS